VSAAAGASFVFGLDALPFLPVPEIDTSTYSGLTLALTRSASSGDNGPMNPNWTKISRLARRLAFALFGGLLLCLVLPLIVATELDPGTVWAYFHGGLPFLIMVLGTAFSYWLFDHLPKKPAPAPDTAERTGA